MHVVLVVAMLELGFAIEAIITTAEKLHLSPLLKFYQMSLGVKVSTFYCSQSVGLPSDSYF